MAQMERLTINLNPVDLGRIEVLVEPGFYANRAPVLKVARHKRARAHLRKVLASVEAILARSSAEFVWFVLLSLTAGTCDTFLFRGCFV